MSKVFILTRDGNGRTLSHPHATLRKAQESIGHSIVDNSYGTKAVAQRFAATVLPDGQARTYGPYTFTLIASTAT